MSYCFILFSLYYALDLGPLLLGGALCLVCVHLHQTSDVGCTHLGGAHPTLGYLIRGPLYCHQTPKRGRLKEHFLAKSIFGCLLLILRYLTILSKYNLYCRWKSEDYLLLAFLHRRLRVSCPETPVCTSRRLWSGTGDSGPSLRGHFSSGVARPRYGGGDSGRKLWLELVSHPETPALATYPGDSGL
jgi:hypothetical protein